MESDLESDKKNNDEEEKTWTEKINNIWRKEKTGKKDGERNRWRDEKQI